MRAAALALLIFLTGCAGFQPSEYPNYWTQEVIVTVWGLYYVSPYGPVGIGYVSWQRNIEKPMTPAAPPGDVMERTKK